jgi:hypothetical protein
MERLTVKYLLMRAFIYSILARMAGLSSKRSENLCLQLHSSSTLLLH